MSGNVEKVFKRLDRDFLGTTFDEFTITNETPSELDWRDVDTTSPLSRNVDAINPILTSPMTTVTEDQMAIVAAKGGGGGVIHNSNTPEEQKRLVRKVKYHLNGIIDEPIYALASETVEHLQERLDNAGFDFRTVPVLDEDNGHFVGLMTSTVFELSIGEDRDVPVGQAMVPADDIATGKSSWRDKPEKAYALMKEHRIKLVPLLTKHGKLDGMYMLDDVQRQLQDNPRGFNMDENGRLKTFMSVSTWSQDAIERVKLSGKYLDMVVIDTSHGESKHTFSTLRALKEAILLVKNLKEDFGKIDVMAGNVSDPEAAVALAKAGADAIRVGRGPGGICISREKLGGGTPQATAIYNCAKAVHDFDPTIQICADGGIRGPGDYVKALALGASSVMVGGYVAGTTEAAAPVMHRADSTQYKEYNGMGSAKELKRSWAAKMRYDPDFEAPSLEDDDVFVEGDEQELALRGSADKKFREMSRGLKVEMCNGGFKDLQDFREGVRILRVTAAGAQEGRANRTTG